MAFDNATWATLIINFQLFLIIHHHAAGVAANVENAASSARADNRKENVTVFLKSWPFRVVQKECESSFLYDYGYTSVLVSSIQDKTLLKGPAEDFKFDDLFKFRTPLGTIEEFSRMIKSCEKNGIKVYVSLKLITDKQIDQVIKKYEELEPILLWKLTHRIAEAKKNAAKGAQNEASSSDDLSKKADITDHPAISHNIDKTPRKPVRFDENFMTKRQHKNTKYLMELVLLNANANAARDKAISSLMQSFKQVNKQYTLRYKMKKILWEDSPTPRLVRKYCKLKYKLEDITSAVQFVRYLAELGVSGVRIENARYIDTGALNEIFTSAQEKIPRKMTLIFDNVVNVKHYQKFGSVMDEKYARNLMNAVKRVNFTKLVSMREGKIWPQTWRNIASSGRSRPFVPKYMLPEDNKDDSHNFKIATAMMLVNPHGFPIIVSPYSRLKNRIISLWKVNRMKMEEICSQGKFCIHRKKFIRQLVLFRLITANKEITSVRAVQNNILYLNRGNKGFAAFIHRSPPSKGKTTPENLTMQTELPPGLYCNIITGYPDLKRGQCDAGSVIQVDLTRRIFIKNVNTYRKGVIAIDILSRLEYMDIEANGKYIFQTKPSPKLERSKGQITGSNYQPRDLDDIREQQTNPTQAISPRTTVPSYEMQTRDLKIGFDNIGKIITVPYKCIKNKKITSIRAVQNNILYLIRGNKGFTAFIHRSPPSKDKPTPENLTIQTELPPGLYCIIIIGYPDLKRGQCDTSSVIQVEMKRRIFIKNVNTYRKGVKAIDILSRLKYMDIEANGKYIFQTKPSSKLERSKGQITGSNYQPRDLDDLREQQTNPTQAISPRTIIPSYEMQTRDVKIELDFGGIGKIIRKSIKAIEKIIGKILRFVGLGRRRHKFPKITYEY